MTGRRSPHPGAATGVTRRGFLIGAGAVAGWAALALSGCSGPGPGGRLTMASGEPGGTYIEFGELLQTAVARRGAFTLDLRATGGSVDNVTLLATGEADLAISLADALDPTASELVAIGQVYQNYLHCVVRAESDVVALHALAGRRVSVGAPGSGAAVTGQRVLDAAGLETSGRAAQTTELSIGDATTALADGSIDALFWSSGIPAPAILALRDRMPLRFIPLAEALPALDAKYPETYQSTALPRGTYGIDDDVPTVGTPNLLLSRRDLPGSIAAALVDVLIDEAQSLVPANTVGVQYLTAANLIDTAPHPLHPAARDRYRERYG